MSVTAILLYWRNDTPNFVTWRSRLATAPDTPTCIVIHGGQFTGGVHTLNQFVPEIVSPLLCSSALVRHTLLIVYFSKELFSVIGSLDKCHTSVSNALISGVSTADLCNVIELAGSQYMMRNDACALFCSVPCYWFDINVG